MSILTEDSQRYTTTSLPTSRRTIVDLLKIVGGGAVPGHLDCDIDMSWANTLRERLALRGHKVTVTAILLKAIGLAQEFHPDSRTEWLPWGKRVTYKDIVAGFTVEREIDGQQTVFLGEIIDPNRKSIAAIADELKHYAADSIKSLPPLSLQNIFSLLPWFMRDAILNVSKRLPLLRLSLQQATFGLTSLGKLGIKSLSSPCLCSCTFTIGSSEDRVVVRNREPVVRSIMTITLNFDQRAIDPNVAARFLQTVHEFMEGGMEDWLEDLKV